MSDDQERTTKRRRATGEPRFCPYCSRHHEGLGLVRHMLDAHQSVMILVRQGDPGEAIAKAQTLKEGGADE